VSAGAKGGPHQFRCELVRGARLLSVAQRIVTASIATVHDSFGCLPSQAERFRQITLEQFVKMYKEHDVLHEVLDCARQDLGSRELPAEPSKGDLKIEEVLKAEFAFA
jgi:DNA-directed RNA polymerase